MKPTTKRTLKEFIAGIAIALSLVGAAYYCLEELSRPTRELWSKVNVGDDEAFVRTTLGTPFREFQRDTAPPDYYVNGWRRKERPITSKVLIYMGDDLILYVWIDESGRVEDLFIGGS